jgi:hypothetical protein
MPISFERLFEQSPGKQLPEWLAPSGHAPMLTTLGWGEPPSYSTSCSCGWQGLTVGTYTPELFIKELQPVLATYGPGAMLGEHEVYGDRVDAVMVILEHLRYDAAAGVDHTQAAVEAALYAVRAVDAQKLDETVAVTRALQAAVDDLLLARDLQAATHERTIPVRPPVPPEAREAYQKAINSRWGTTNG